MNSTTHQCQASHGATLVYDVMGQGAPVVLLHGNSQDSSYFEQQFDVLSQSYQLIAMDTRAHGRSSRGTAPLDFISLPMTSSPYWMIWASKKRIFWAFPTGEISRSIPC